MCMFTCDGSCRSTSGSAGVGDVVEGVARGAWFVVRRIALPVTALTAGAIGLYVAGAPMTPRAKRLRTASGATWLRKGGKIHPARLRIHWYGWAGWERTVARLAFAALLVAGWLAPLLVAVCTASLVVVATGAVLVRRTAVQRRAVGPRVVRAVVGDHSRPAIAASPATRLESLFSFLGKMVGVPR